MKQPAFVTRACVGHGWNATVYDETYFRELTPCFNDIAIVSLTHLVFIVGIIIRCTQLHNRTNDHVKLTTARVYYVRAVLGAIAALAPAFALVSKTAAFSTGTADQLDLYGPNGDSILPFEIIYYTVVIAAYIAFTVVAILETRATVIRGQWIMRFISVFGFLALTVRMIYIVQLEKKLGHHGVNFLTADFMLMYAAVGLLALIAALHWPSADRFVVLEYRLVPVYVATTVTKEQGICPESTAGLWSRATFSWMTPMIKYGYAAVLQDSDVWLLASPDTAQVVHAQVAKQWQAQLKLPKPSMFKALFFTFWPRFFVAWLFKFFNDASQFLGPMMLQLLIENTTSRHPDLQKGVLLALGMFLGQVVGAIAECQYFQIVMRTGMHVRSAMVISIFKKATILSPEGRGEHSSGKIANMISSDCENLQQTCSGLLNMWSSPARIVVAVYLLQHLLGPSAYVALAILVVCVPLQKKLVGITMKYLKASLKSTDERVKLGQEVMGAMEIVKCYAWESSLKDRVLTTRETELYWIRKRQIVAAINSFMISAVPVAVTVFTFLVYTASGNDLTPAVAFTALSLFSVLRMPLIMLPFTINNFISAGVSLGRLQAFLLADDLADEPELTSAKRGEDALTVARADFKWGKDEPPALHDIELRVEQGSLLTIIGGTGMGKSSLVSAILGEMIVGAAPVPGNPVRRRGTISYVGQQAWIFNATVRENILFGRKYDAKRYQHAVWLASLTRDFTEMDAGDQTEIGEKGVNLSGGQKQRLSIARAIYADTDIILMDDPLSALDAHVAKEIYERCILKHFEDKTVIFVTNRLEFVESSDKVLVMQDGRIAGLGTYTELDASCEAFQVLMADQGINEKSEDSATDAEDFVFEPEADVAAKQVLPAVSVSQGAKSVNSDGSEEKQKGGLIQAEARETGGVGAKLIQIYATAMGGLPVLIFLLMSFVSVEGLRLYASIWIKDWSNEMHSKTNDDTAKTHSNYYYIGIYAAISAGQSVSALVSSLYGAITGVRAGRHLHAGMFSRLLRAPMSFFNATPLGRIVNRLSKDTADIDRNLVSSVSIFLRGLLQVLGTFIIIGTSTPYTLAAFAPILAMFWWTYRFFQTSNRELKRLDSVARSPIYSYFGQCLSGMPTIRAFDSRAQVEASIAGKIDAQTRMTLALFSANRWLSLRLELLGGLMILVCALFLVIGAQNGAVDPGTIGLALSYALQITGLLNMTVRLAAVAENSFNSVERVDEYANVDSEAVDGPAGVRPPPADWPAHGHIKFEGVSMRYRDDLPLVLKTLDFEATPAQKIGIVGRTGAGKSSTFLTLFRIVEAATGKIFIDGLDISKMSLFALRSKLSIIPQDPVLFTGPIRFNLDPFGDYEEQLLWDALDRAHLKTLVASMPKGLDTEVVENGENFSVGQRQLLCLARALIRRSSILVLDEATAAVDVGTDALIQKTIREEFANCTVLAIAHRLNTIIDSDRVLVLDAGEKVEFGSPADLLRNPDGIFTSMVNDTGDSNARFLRSVAFGEASLAEALREISAEARASVNVRMASIDDLNTVKFRSPLLERTRSALLSIKGMLVGAGTTVWTEALAQEPGLSEGSWLSDMRSIFEEFVALATDKIGDGDEYTGMRGSAHHGAMDEATHLASHFSAVH
jgi:ABC-type multidrug transport system fused ATPase/permease subunit